MARTMGATAWTDRKLEPRQVLDLRTSPLTPLEAVTEEPRVLAVGLPWTHAIDQVAAWARDPSALDARPEKARRARGFSVQTDSAGQAAVAVADQPSAARLTQLLRTATPHTNSGHTLLQSLSDAPHIKDRAVLECFYGPLWGSEARRNVVDRAAAHGATTYVYGPAADRRTGGRWREPYGPDTEALAQLVEHAHLHGMEVVWRVSPSAPLERDAAMRLSDPDELSIFLRRLREVAQIGVDRILIAFDDINGDLDAATRSEFAHDPQPMAAAHAKVINAAADELGSFGVNVIACPTHYWGTQPSRYRHRFGELLAPDLPVCWTGPGVISATITAPQAREVSQQFQHPIWLWDNYPVNDWDGMAGEFNNELEPRRLPLTPVHGRDPQLGAEVVGYGSNAAIQPYSGLPAISTALDWAWAGDEYQPEQAFVHALSETGLALDPLLLLADSVAPVPAGRSGPGELAETCIDIIKDAGTGNHSELRLTAARTVFTKHHAASRELASQEGPLARELMPWLKEVDRGCSGALLALDILEAYPDNQDLIDERALQLRPLARTQRGPSVSVNMLDALIEYARGLGGGGTPEKPD